MQVLKQFHLMMDESWQVIDASQSIEAIQSKLRQHAAAAIEKCRHGEPLRQLWDGAVMSTQPLNSNNTTWYFGRGIASFCWQAPLRRLHWTYVNAAYVYFWRPLLLKCHEDTFKSLSFSLHSCNFHYVLVYAMPCWSQLSCHKHQKGRPACEGMAAFATARFIVILLP